MVLCLQDMQGGGGGLKLRAVGIRSLGCERFVEDCSGSLKLNVEDGLVFKMFLTSSRAMV